ncbi:MAG: metallophosphoesterase family protein [Kiritimatiellia bacterium]
MMDYGRRDFLTMGAAALLAAELPRAVHAARGPIPPLKLERHEVSVGAAKPFGAVQVSDTHIVRVDARDDERKMKLAAKRSFTPFAEHYLDEAIALAKGRGDLLLHTGDLIDFVSAANLDLAEAHFAGNDWFVSAGNHEFSQYVGEAREDEAYKRASFARVQAAYPNDLAFCARVVNGVNFVSLDDVYYNVTERQHELFMKEVEKGLPIVMLCHIPLYGPKLYDFVMSHTNNACAYVTGAPLELTSTYQGKRNPPPGEEWRARAVQQRTDKPTADFIAWLREQKLLKAILCGHLHHVFQERFSPTAVQYVCGATYKGMAQEFRFV